MSLKLAVATALLTSLTCFAQIVSSGGYATTSGPLNTSAANAPLLSTPDAALPGSGPAVGAPLSNTNDSRSSTGPSVYNPNGIVFATESTNTTPANSATQTAATTNAATAANQPFEFGVQQFGMSGPSTTSSQSLGEIARDLRAHRRAATKVLNNESVARLNTASAGMGTIAAQDTNAVASASANGSAQPSATSTTLMAQNQSPALPQSDNEAATQSQSAAQTSSTANQQRHATAQSAPASDQEPANGTAEQRQNSAATQTATNSKLPQTGSHLPLLLLLGSLGVAGGALYYIRR